jgi:alpha-L-arabinofuranosidase
VASVWHGGITRRQALQFGMLAGAAVTLVQGAGQGVRRPRLQFGMLAGAVVTAPQAEQMDAAAYSASEQISVDTATQLRAVDRRILGMNTNYLTDHADVRDSGQGYGSALRTLGVGSLRYPGGEEADSYLWSSAPFTAPQPKLARTGPAEWPSNDPRWVSGGTKFVHAPLDFDQFMAYCRDLGAEPTVVVPMDAMYRPAAAGSTAPDKQLLLDTAVAWVRYANLVKGYGVQHWELGNESYKASYIGGTTADQYARDAVDFARAMKQVDPTIKIGINGPDSQFGRSDYDASGAWWQMVLPVAAPVADFLVVHSYPAWGWGGYNHYATHTPNLTAAVDGVQAALHAWSPPRDADRIRVRVTEINAADWSDGGWPNVNNLGHAVVLFDQIGGLLTHPAVEAAQVWTTRWTNAAATDLWNTLDPANALLATGQALAIWSQFLRSTMIATTSTTLVRSFASYDPVGQDLSVFLINKDTTARTATVTLRNYGTGATGSRWSLLGSGPNDPAPVWSNLGEVTPAGNSLQLVLAPVSVTAVSLRPAASLPT